MKTHEIKTHEIKLMCQFFDDVEKREKNFEIRFNDKKYSVEDWLVLREWDGEDYTGRYCVRQITRVYELDSIGFKGWVAMAIE